ncbi:uncharacterized protein F5147DRAFT_773330 [Suillus discolor]|uniref:Uncharacterized protein n=1 Tax=Suillus discolor TaxID=1912936 RepID=A0A9P7F891_9AGAM|nr:uncharacterized protein F5147DRAFT_773330 [Suillus discolor]KAG2108995.1 hypothetical protein F5147DRAFT_773330 [Suillus discolor]
MSQAEDNVRPGALSQTPQPATASSQAPQPAAASSIAVPTSENARQQRRIADLEEKLQVLEAGQAVKKSIEDLISENDRRCNNDDDDNVTVESIFYFFRLTRVTYRFVDSQDHLQLGYIVLNNVLPWFHRKASDMEYDDYTHMLKMLRQGADGARGDDTSKLKSLVPEWVNHDFKPDPPVDPKDKFCRGFTNDTCGRLLCPSDVRAGIRDRVDGHVVTEMSWPAFLYAGYTADQNNFEEGLFKSKLLVQAFKAHRFLSYLCIKSL